MSPAGIQEKFYTVSINGGVIADLTIEMPHAIFQNDAEPQEQVAIRYRDISWTHHLAKTAGYSTQADRKGCDNPTG